MVQGCSLFLPQLCGCAVCSVSSVCGIIIIIPCQCMLFIKRLLFASFTVQARRSLGLDYVVGPLRQRNTRRHSHGRRASRTSRQRVAATLGEDAVCHGPDQAAGSRTMRTYSFCRRLHRWGEYSGDPQACAAGGSHCTYWDSCPMRFKRNRPMFEGGLLEELLTGIHEEVRSLSNRGHPLFLQRCIIAMRHSGLVRTSCPITRVAHQAPYHVKTGRFHYWRTDEGPLSTLSAPRKARVAMAPKFL